VLKRRGVFVDARNKSGHDDGRVQSRRRFFV
jgi:hypothetical protein